MDRKKFEKAWKLSENVKEVCKRLKITEQSAYYWARKFGLPMFCGISDENTPTQEEIQERAAEIRARWSPEEEKRRCAGSGFETYQMPSYSAARSSGSKYPVFVGEN